jgi:hypothetical protein
MQLSSVTRCLRSTLPTTQLDAASTHAKRWPTMASASAITRSLIFSCLDITVGTCMLLGVGHSSCLLLSLRLWTIATTTVLCGDGSHILHLCDGKECNRVFLKLQMPVSFFFTYHTCVLSIILTYHVSYFARMIHSRMILDIPSGHIDVLTGIEGPTQTVSFAFDCM